MGCDIHAFAEKKLPDGTYQSLDMNPFDWRAYGMFAFLAGVRNYSAVKPIAPLRGLPEDVSADVEIEAENWDRDAHSYSWLTVEELAAFDYGAKVEDRRYMDETGNGGATCVPGKGQTMTWAKFLGSNYMLELKKLKSIGADRVVFWFDN